MKAAIFTGKGNIEVRDIPRPEISPEEVLLKVQKCSICGTDRKIYKYGHSNIEEGEEQILGHEITGVIDQVGENVDYYQRGMRIVLAPNVGCGYCDMCRKGLDQLCEDYNAFGIGWPGGFAEYVKIPEAAIKRGNMIEIPEGMNFEKAAVIEPLSCCYNAYESLDIEPGDSILIFGAGPMGILHLVLNKFLGSGLSIITDVDQQRLRLSENHGADYTLISNSNLKEKAMDITDGKGVDVVITAAPVPDIQELALKLVATNGKICYFAGLPAGKEKINFNSNIVHYKQLRVTGTTGASIKQFRKTVKFSQSKDLILENVITKEIGLERLSTIFEEDSIFSNNLKIVVNMELG